MAQILFLIASLIISKISANNDDWNTARSMLPSRIELGQVVAVAVEPSTQNLVLFHRGPVVWDQYSFSLDERYQKVSDGAISEPTILVYNPRSRKVISEGGSNMFYMPHGLSIGPTGSVWVTDVALHQVMRLEPSWNVSRDFLRSGVVMGQAFQPGNDASHFCKPTGAVESPDGSSVFVADGYCNGRVVRFDARSGAYLDSFGDVSQSWAKPGTFFVPHSLVLIENRDLVCVADRENKRVQCFKAGLQNSLEFGLFQSNIEHPMFSQIFAVQFDKKDQSLLALSRNSASMPGEPNLHTVFRIDMTTFTVIKRYNILGGIQKGHDMALDKKGNGYIAEIGPNRIWKLFRK